MAEPVTGSDSWILPEKQPAGAVTASQLQAVSVSLFGK